ncbi:MAG: DNA polymerase III subunit delta' [Candidatus Tectimicrobiota bacterium]|nr:MAG: DNA polymerase III subunit delta' [Candidatus Tectomicrobia bacterium]
MGFAHIEGQARAVQLLRRALASGRVAHAYLFYGPSGVGKRLTALQFLKALYCQALPDDSCDACAACRKVASGNHPDVLRLAPEGGTLGIEAIRALQRRLGYRPYEGVRTAVLLEDCDALSLPAANALLKTLEEPPAEALLLLLTCRKAALPLTVVSRCQPVPFQPLTPAQRQALFERQGLDRETAAAAAAFVQSGLPLPAGEALPLLRELRQQALALLQALARGEVLPAFLEARALAGQRERCELLLHWLALLCRDLAVVRLSPATGLYNPTLRQALSALAAQLSPAALLAAFTRIDQARQRLAAHGNAQLLFEALLLELQPLLSP